MSGGSNGTTDLASINYFDQAGIIKNNNYQRFTGRVNLDQKLGNHVKVGLSVSMSRNKNKNVRMRPAYTAPCIFESFGNLHISLFQLMRPFAALLIQIDFPTGMPVTSE